MNVLEFLIAVTLSSIAIMGIIKLMDIKFGLMGVFIVAGFSVIASATFTSFDATSVMGVNTNVVILIVFWTGACIDYIGTKYGRVEAGRMLDLCIIMNVLWTVLCIVLALIAQPAVEGITPISALLGKSTIISTTLGLTILKLTQTFDMNMLRRARARWMGVSKLKLGVAIAVISMVSLIMDTILYFGGINIIFNLMNTFNYHDVYTYSFIPVVFTIKSGVLKVLLSAYGNVVSGVSIPYLVALGSKGDTNEGR